MLLSLPIMLAILVNIHHTFILINLILLIIGFTHTARNIINPIMNAVAVIICEEDSQEEHSGAEIAELLRDHTDSANAAFTLDTLVPEEEAEIFEYEFENEVTAAARHLPDNSFDEHMFYEYFHSEAYAGDLAYNQDIHLPSSGVFSLTGEHSGGLIVAEDSLEDTELEIYEAMDEDISVVDFGLVRTQSCYF